MDVKQKANEMRAYLKKHYGINNDKELLEALKNLPPLDIGIFVSPVPEEVKEASRRRCAMM